MDKDAFSQTYEEYATEIYRFCVHKTGNKEDAEDLVSRAFTKLYEQSGEIENPRAWLYRVTRNMLYDKYVTNNKKDQDAELNEEVEIIDESISIEGESIDESLVATIKSSISDLNSDTADIVTMRVWDEMSFKEIAEAIEMEEASARKRFHRGIAELKSLVNAKQHTKGLSTITVSMLLAGTLQLGKVKAFSVSSGFTVGLFNTLGIPIMNLTQAAAGGAASAGIFTTASAKAAAAIVASVAIVAGGVGVAVVNNNNSDSAKEENTEIVTPTETDESEQANTTTCDVTELGLTFEMPEGWECSSNVSALYYSVLAKSDKFTLYMTNEGRGAPCIDEGADCTSEQFYDGDQFTYTFFGTNDNFVEIFGYNSKLEESGDYLYSFRSQPDIVAININAGFENTISAEEEAQLLDVVESISYRPFEETLFGIETKECKLDELGISYKINSEWNCEGYVLEDNESYSIEVTSDSINIDMTNLGRGVPCSTGLETEGCDEIIDFFYDPTRFSLLTSDTVSFGAIRDSIEDVVDSPFRRSTIIINSDDSLALPSVEDMKNLIIFMETFDY